MLIKNTNLLHQGAQKTYLTNTESAGTTVLRVRNSTGMTTSWAIQVGETGEEQTEVLIGTAPNAGTITCTTTDFEHPADTPIYFTKYDQVVFERSTIGTSGVATSITNGTIEYQADSRFTQFDDTSGSASYAYRTLLRNSVLAVNTTESDWIVITPPFYSLAIMRQRVKEKLWNADYLTDPVLDNWLNEWLFEMRNSAIAVNEDYALGTVDVGFGTAGLGTVVTTDFKQPRRLWVTYNGADYFQSTKMDINDFVPDEQFSSVHPYHAWFGDNTFQIKPEESGGTARIAFYRIGTAMVNDTDELEIPLRGYTKSFVDYALGQALMKDGKTTESQGKIAEALGAKNQFTQEASPRDKTGPTNIRIIEGISGWDGFS